MKFMASKNYRVIARKTTYFYLDVVVSRKDEAVEKGWATPEAEFKTLPDPQNEWKVIDAVIMDKDEAVDELKYLSKS